MNSSSSKTFAGIKDIKYKYSPDLKYYIRYYVMLCHNLNKLQFLLFVYESKFSKFHDGRLDKTIKYQPTNISTTLKALHLCQMFHSITQLYLFITSAATTEDLKGYIYHPVFCNKY